MPDRPVAGPPRPPTTFGDEDDDLPPPPTPRPPAPPVEDQEEDEAEEDLDDEGPRMWDPGSPAANYRRSLERRRAPWRVTAAIVVLLVIAGSAWYIVTTPRPAGSASSGAGGCTSGCVTPPTVIVTLSAPTVSSVTCGQGGSASVEAITWIGSSAPLSTVDVFLEVTEITDGDIIGGSGSAPLVTRSNLCPGYPPSPAYSWYVVLQDSGGANVMTFSYADGWAYVGPGPSSLPLANGTAMFLVISPAVAGSGYALDIGGTEGGPAVSGSVAL